jgi:hypothetical protein
MGNPFDQLGKKIGLRALGPSGPTEVLNDYLAGFFPPSPG